MSKAALADLKARVYGAMDLTPCNECDQCHLRCADGVPMSRAEFVAVKDHLETAVDAGLARDTAAKRSVADLGDGHEVTLCRFYDRVARGCIVYAARPMICRLMGHVEWLPCPVGKVPLTVETGVAVDLMRAYAAEERATFEEWEDRAR